MPLAMLLIERRDPKTQNFLMSLYLFLGGGIQQAPGKSLTSPNLFPSTYSVVMASLIRGSPPGTMGLPGLSQQYCSGFAIGYKFLAPCSITLCPVIVCRPLLKAAAPLAR